MGVIAGVPTQVSEVSRRATVVLTLHVDGSYGLLINNGNGVVEHYGRGTGLRQRLEDVEARFRTVLLDEIPANIVAPPEEEKPL